MSIYSIGIAVILIFCCFIALFLAIWLVKKQNKALIKDKEIETKKITLHIRKMLTGCIDWMKSSPSLSYGLLSLGLSLVMVTYLGLALNQPLIPFLTKYYIPYCLYTLIIFGLLGILETAITKTFFGKFALPKFLMRVRSWMMHGVFISMVLVGVESGMLYLPMYIDMTEVATTNVNKFKEQQPTGQKQYQITRQQLTENAIALAKTENLLTQDELNAKFARAVTAHLGLFIFLAIITYLMMAAKYLQAISNRLFDKNSTPQVFDNKIGLVVKKNLSMAELAYTLNELFDCNTYQLDYRENLLLVLLEPTQANLLGYKQEVLEKVSSVVNKS